MPSVRRHEAQEFGWPRAVLGMNFVNPVTAILKHLEATIKPVDAPIPVVAVSSIDTTKLVDAFDLGIIPPELLSDETSEQAREEMEQWAYHAHFRILKKSNANFSAEVILNGTVLGAIDFEMDLSDAESVKWRLESRARNGRNRRAFGKGSNGLPTFTLGENLV